MKVIFIKKSLIVLLGAILIFFSAFSINKNLLDVSGAYSATLKKVPIYRVETEENKLSISFDAAWGADKTKNIMDICDSFNVKATFFLVGFWVKKYPDLVKEIYNRGFEIGIHSNTHPDMTKLSVSQIKEELEINIKLIQEITGDRANLFRPPYGYYNNKLIDICEDLNIKCIEWDVDSLDWKGLSASDVAGRVLSKAKKGSIVLFHNNSDNIINALKLVLQTFKEKSICVVSIGDLIYKENYTINNFGVQIKNTK